jgi:hypothetical protein
MGNSIVDRDDEGDDVSRSSIVMTGCLSIDHDGQLDCRS